MILYALLVVSLNIYVNALRCNKCIKFDLKNSLTNLPGIGSPCIQTQCEGDKVCFGMKGELTTDIGPISTKSTVMIQDCINRKDLDMAPWPICNKADVKYLNKFLAGAKFLLDGSNIQVDGYSCTCTTDSCDSICENGFIIANTVCVPKWFIGVSSAGSVALLLLITCCCCCCCCGGCCCRKRNNIAPIAANPLIIVHPGNRGTESASYRIGYAPNQLPAYEYISNDDDAPLIKP